MENTSCIEGLKLLLDYKQRQYAEGIFIHGSCLRRYCEKINYILLLTDMQAMDNELVKNTCFQSSSRHETHIISLLSSRVTILMYIMRVCNTGGYPKGSWWLTFTSTETA